MSGKIKICSKVIRVYTRGFRRDSAIVVVFWKLEVNFVKVLNQINSWLQEAKYQKKTKKTGESEKPCTIAPKVPFW